MKFEMPKMNVAIFSCENIVTTSGIGGDTTPTTVTNESLALQGLKDAGVAVEKTTVISFDQWANA